MTKILNVNFNMEKSFFPNTQQGFPFHSGGVGEGNFELMFAIVRNRPCRLGPVPLGTAARDYCLGFPALHSFVTFDVSNNLVAWQAHYFRNIVKKCVAGFRGRPNTLDASNVILRQSWERKSSRFPGNLHLFTS